MRTRDRLSVLLSCLAVALSGVGCGDKPAPSTGAAKPAEDAHAHPKAPHGGELLELGEEEAHLEIVHDAKAGSVTVYVLDKDGKTPVATAAPTIALTTKDGVKDVALTAVGAKADGTADTWQGSHEGLKVEPPDGRVRVTVRGKAYQTPLESPGHGH